MNQKNIHFFKFDSMYTNVDGGKSAPYQKKDNTGFVGIKSFSFRHFYF